MPPLYTIIVCTATPCFRNYRPASTIRRMATDKVQVNVYLDKKTVRKLDEVRKVDGFSRSAVIRRLLRRYLRKLEARKQGGDSGPQS